MIEEASQSIYIEQMEVSLTWDTDHTEYENYYLKAAIAAAQERQVEVKILLSSAFSYPDNPKLDNYDTVSYINNYAINHNITDYLSARLMDYDRLGLSKLHNKGLVVDGKKTLISSINWVRNSVAQNREVGVIIESTEVAEYFTQVFFWDWNEPPVSNAGSDITATTMETIEFNEPSYDSDDNIISYFWDFDDGTNSTLKNPSHRFSKEGVYEVKLTVFDGQYTDSSTITVIASEAEATEGELGLVIYGSLLIIFIVIFLTIITFLRRMRFKFL
jgi:PKD repeat protein